MHTVAAANLAPLVLLGAGPTHVRWVAKLAQRPLADLTVHWITPQAQSVHAGLLASYISGALTLAQCSLDLAALAQRAGVHWQAGTAQALDSQARLLTLADARDLPFQRLSVDTEAVQVRANIEARLPGAREHALFLHPLDSFVALWPRVLEKAQQQPLRIALLGADPLALELAFALRQRLPDAAITVLADEPATLGYWAAASPTAERLRQALRAQRVTLLHDQALALSPGIVQLACGAGLACDIPILCNHTQIPPWLEGVSEAFALLVKPAPWSPQAPVHLLPGRAALTHWRRAVLEPNAPAPTPTPPPSPWHWLAMGACGAMVGNGRWSVQTRALGWLLRTLERRQVAQAPVESTTP